MTTWRNPILKEMEPCLQEMYYKGSERELWDWVWVLECVCLLGIFRMGEFEHLHG